MPNGDLRKSIKYDMTKNTNMDEFHRKSLDYAIDKYEKERYRNILYEKKLIESILNNSEDFDEEIRLKYTNKYEALKREQFNIQQEYIKKNRKDEDKRDEIGE